MSADTYIVMVTMQYSDSEAPDEIFGPFATGAEAKEWMEASVSDRNAARVRQLRSVPDKTPDEYRWWSW